MLIETVEVGLQTLTHSCSFWRTRHSLFIVVTSLVCNLGGESTGDDSIEPIKPSRPPFKNVVNGRFEIGVGIGERFLSDPACAELLRRHFQIITPENCMKPQGIHPAEDEWNFEATDRFVAFAKQNQLDVVGHCLVWAKDDRTDDWMMHDEAGQPVSKAQLLSRIENHVETVVSRYHETATMWDVVNEALADGDAAYLRDSVYSRTAGIDFIETAFRAAKRHDPNAILIYNDYNCHFPVKRQKLIRLLTELKAREVPVDAYGMQGHFELSDDSLTQLRETFEELRKLDIKVVVSELDIDVVTRSRWWADDGKYREELKTYDPFKDGLPTEIELKQIDQYVKLFRLFDEYEDVIVRVSFWNLHDGQSWLNDFPWTRTNYPLLFNRELQPKPVYDAVVAALLETRFGHETRERTDWMSRAAHEQLLAKAKQGKIDVYFQGDSITRRWGATDYPELLDHWTECFHGWNAANFAWGGDTTHNILWRMRNGELDGLNPKIVVLQAGTNNLPWTGTADQETIDDVVEGIEAIIQEFQSRVPASVIVLTALFPRDQNPELAPAIKQINTRLKSFADRNQIRCVNINDKLTDDNGALRAGFSRDGLHLERPAYVVWAAELQPIFREVLGPPIPKDLAPSPTGLPEKPDP